MFAEPKPQLNYRDWVQEVKKQEATFTIIKNDIIEQPINAYPKLKLKKQTSVQLKNEDIAGEDPCEDIQSINSVPMSKVKRQATVQFANVDSCEEDPCEDIQPINSVPMSKVKRQATVQLAIAEPAEDTQPKMSNL